jgi:hypothetical protein
MPCWRLAEPGLKRQLRAPWPSSITESTPLPRCPTATGAREQAGPLKETAPTLGGDAGAVPGPSGGLGGVIAGERIPNLLENESFLIFEPVSSFLGLIWLMSLS